MDRIKSKIYHNIMFSVDDVLNKWSEVLHRCLFEDNIVGNDDEIEEVPIEVTKYSFEEQTFNYSNEHYKVVITIRPIGKIEINSSYMDDGQISYTASGSSEVHVQIEYQGFIRKYENTFSYKMNIDKLIVERELDSIIGPILNSIEVDLLLKK